MNYLFDHIEKRSEQYIKRLRDLCRQPSISTRGVGMLECADMVRKMMKQLGINTQATTIADGYPVLFGELKSSRAAGKTLIMYDHYDVQPPEPLHEWESEPFSADVKDGKIFARGVSDNKGNLVARLCATEAILDTLGDIPVNLKFVFEGEEEIGSPSLAFYINENKGKLCADGGIWEAGYKDPSGRLKITLGNKGQLYLELRSRVAHTNQHSSWAAIVPNAGWRVIWALQTFKDDNENILIDGFYDNVKEPSEAEFELLEKSFLDEKGFKAVFGIKDYLRGSSGSKLLKDFLYQPTCTISGILSGYTGIGENSINPCEAMAKIDFRLVADQTPEEIKSKVMRHLKKHGFDDLRVKEVSHFDVAKCSPEAEIVQTVIATAKQVYKTDPIVWPTSAGSGPTHLFTNTMGVPMVGGVGVGHAGSNNHAPNENIRIRDYIDGIKHLAAILVNF
jgi:acetylornithine deacetylase/succinyl-diaminopimelate desuccinylase-like protein